MDRNPHAVAPDKDGGGESLLHFLLNMDADFHEKPHRRASLVTSKVHPSLTHSMFRNDIVSAKLIDIHSAELFVRYQRATLSGEDISGALSDDHQTASNDLLNALLIRSKYMAMAAQSFPKITARLLQLALNESLVTADQTVKEFVAQYVADLVVEESEESIVVSSKPVKYSFEMVKGVMKVSSNEAKESWVAVDRDQFIDDQKYLLKLVHNGPLKSFCVRRLAFLSSKFNMHKLLNEINEKRHLNLTFLQCTTIRMVDNHVEASSSMNRHLLRSCIGRFVNEAARSGTDEKVFTLNGQPMTLIQVFAALNIPRDQMTLSILDQDLMQANPSYSKQKPIVIEEELIEEKRKSSPLCGLTSPSIITLPAFDDESLGAKVRTKQTFKISRCQSLRGAWMAMPVRDWDGPSFGDISSPVSDAIVSAMGARPIRRWQIADSTNLMSSSSGPPSSLPVQVRPIRNHSGLSKKTAVLKRLDDGRGGAVHNQCSKVVNVPGAVHKGLAFKARDVQNEDEELADLLIVNNHKQKSVKRLGEAKTKEVVGAERPTSKRRTTKPKPSKVENDELFHDEPEFTHETSGKDELALEPGPDSLQAQYNSFKQPGLRQLFLSSNNAVNGRYFAAILKKVVDQLEASRYQMAEMKLVLQCKSLKDWHTLADWTSEHQLMSPSIRWLIEIPRLYGMYKKNGVLKSFDKFLANIFQPLFEVTVNPESDPKLSNFLNSVTGFNLIAAEPMLNQGVLKKDDPSPEEWKTSANPSNDYYGYYIYANMVSLNRLRREKGYNTFSLRPHCLGSVQQLTAAFMTSESIAHISTVLSKAPVLMYLFYLARVGITTSVVTTAKASKRTLDRNLEPLVCYLNCGLFASLSTFQPLRTHWTSEPLVEEQRIAANLLKLTQTDLSELSRNSLFISGFSDLDKMRWLGPNFEHDGPAGNSIQRTGLSNIRVAFRFETFVEELSMILHSLKFNVADVD